MRFLFAFGLLGFACVMPVHADFVTLHGGVSPVITVDGESVRSIEFDVETQQRVFQMQVEQLKTIKAAIGSSPNVHPFQPDASMFAQLTPAQRDVALAAQQIQFHGRFTAYEKGTRSGDWYGPQNHDQMIFQGFAPGGSGMTGEAVAISAVLPYTVVHEVDSLEDLVWAFSDRHEISGNSFGSPAHRDSFFAIVDPAGDVFPPFGGGGETQATEEGRVTSFLINGRPSRASVAAGGGWDRFVPNRVTANEQINDYLIDHLLLMVSAVRARQYEAVPAEMEQRIKDMMAMLCTLSLADPALVSGRYRSRAERAVELGEYCHRAILYSVLLDEDNIATRYELGVMPADRVLLADIALDLILKEDIFTIFLDADPLIEQNPDEYSHLRPGHDLFDRLLDMAFAPTDWVTDELSAKARRAAIRILDPGSISPLTDEELHIVDRRYYRSALIGFNPELEEGVTPGDNELAWSLNLLCEVGWGHPSDLNRVARDAVDGLIGATTDITYAYEGKDLIPSQRRAARSARRIALLSRPDLRKMEGVPDFEEWFAAYIQRQFAESNPKKRDWVPLYEQYLDEARKNVRPCGAG